MPVQQQMPPVQGQTQQAKTSTPKQTGKDVKDSSRPHPDDKEREKNVVKQWQGRCRNAKKKQESVFREMRNAMKFAAGLQWPGQKDRNDRRYTANWVLREVNSKVAALYAKNPKAEFTRKPRLDFSIYDGKIESVMPMLQAAQAHPMGLAALPIESRALLLDFQHGVMERKKAELQGKTLEVLFQHQLDEQDEEEGEFKLQFKQMVRRTIISKVGYIRVSFVRDTDMLLTSSGPGNTVANRALQIKSIAEKTESGELNRTSKQIEELNSLSIGLTGTIINNPHSFGENERLVYDCLPSTSLLIDPRCRALKGFIGAKWVAIEYHVARNDVNAIFEVDIKSSAGSANTDNSRDSGINQVALNQGQSPEVGEEIIKVWEVLDKETRTHFYISDSYEKFLSEPEFLEPAVRGFWPIYALTFNDIEADVDSGQTPFPPSDVELLIHAQKEYNRSREELKKHRIANRPRWMGPNGILSSDDMNNLSSADTNDFVPLQNIPQGIKPADVFTPFPKSPIEPAVYDTSPQLQDAQLTTGNPSESIGIDKNDTATGKTITEQNRLTVTSSNVDDVDDCLTWIARVSAEMMIQGFSPATVQNIVGPGAVWPQLPQDKQNLLCAITLTTRAGSSGRPNKRVDLANWQIAAPVLQAAGANPMFMVRETLRRLDDNLEPEEAFPLLPSAPQTLGQSAGNQSPSGGEQQPSQQEQHQPGVNTPPEQSRPGPGAIGSAQGEQNEQTISQ